MLCRRLAKRNSGKRPDECCQILQESMATGVQLAQQCLQVRILLSGLHIMHGYVRSHKLMMSSGAPARQLRRLPVES